MRERAIFIGSISVWDTIGTLPASGIEIVTLFRPVYCCVMGRKAPRKRLACRGESAFTRVLHALWHAPRVPRTHPNVSRRSAAVSSKLMHPLDNSDRLAAIPASFPVRNGIGSTVVARQLDNSADADPLARLAGVPLVPLRLLAGNGASARVGPSVAGLGDRWQLPLSESHSIVTGKRLTWPNRYSTVASGDLNSIHRSRDLCVTVV